MSNSKLNWLLSSRAYIKAKALVGSTLNSPQKLLELVASAQIKTTKNLGDSLNAIMEPVNTVIRLLKAYASGEYRDISLESLTLIAASIIYFVMPVDVIPDFIIALGYTDDAALLAWTLRSVSQDLERFIAWENKQKSTHNQAKINKLDQKPSSE